jgi:hypothetical protein
MKWFLGFLVGVMASLISMEVAARTAQTTHLRDRQPDFSVSRIQLFSTFSSVSTALSPIGQSPRVPTIDTCSQEFSECNYVDNKGITYATNGDIIGQITWSRQGRSWSKPLPYGLNVLDSPDTMYRKLLRHGFNLQGGVGRNPQSHNAFISWAFNEHRQNMYFVTLIFDSQNRLSKFTIKAYGW